MKKLLVYLSSAVLSVAILFACKEEPKTYPVKPDLAAIPEPYHQCVFPDLMLPKDTLVYAVEAKNGTELSFQVDESNHGAVEYQVFVNVPDKPVVLMLQNATSDPSIWQIRQTPGTKIMAVYVNGSSKQIVTGLDPQIPRKISSDKGGCAFSVESQQQKRLDIISKVLFDRLVSQSYRVDEPYIYIGLPIAETQYRQDIVQPSESFRLVNTPLIGAAGLQEALEQGVIRRATSSDFERWIAMQPLMQDIPPVNGDINVMRMLPEGFGFNPYVILKPFHIPAGLYGARSVTFILEKGVEFPKGELGHSNLLDLNTGDCIESGGRACYRDVMRTPPKIPESCLLGNTEFPETLKVFAAGAHSGKKLNIQIDQSGHQATEMRVYVNEPSHPVALMLGAYEPTIWQIYKTEGTEIFAVYTSGYYNPIISGIDAKTLVINGKNCSGSYFYIDEKYLPMLNPFSRQLFGQPVDRAFPAQSGEVFIGDRQDLSAYRQDVVRPSESFRLQGAPLAGKAGLDEAVRQGVLRYATEDDINAWLEYNDKSNNNTISIEDDKTRRSFIGADLSRGRVYVILKPFQVPAGLYGSNSATFILQADVPYPTGNLGHSKLFQMGDGACIGLSCR